MLPRDTERLFPDCPADVMASESGRLFVALRLAEEGDRRDLRWLTEQLGEEALRRALRRYGERQLSRRSLAFWRRLLDLPRPAANEDRAAPTELWPL